MPEYKYIPIQDETRSKLQELGQKSESYDDIINRLISVFIQQTDDPILKKKQELGIF